MLINELIAVTLRQAAPLMLSAYGGAFTYHAGVINIAMEAEILIGAFVSLVVGSQTNNLLLSLLGGILGSIGIALLFSFLVERLRANVVTAALGLNILATAVSRLLMWLFGGSRGVLAPEKLPALPSFFLPGAANVPIIGGLLGQSALVYGAWGAWVFTTFILYFTRLGLRVRAVGENPEAARATGIKNVAVRTFAQLLCGLLCGLAGAQLSLGDLRVFTSRISAGKGFIALAAIYFGRGRPAFITLACLLFGFFDGLQSRLQLWAQVPPQLAQMLPFVIVVFALVTVSYAELRRRKTLWKRQA